MRSFLLDALRKGKATITPPAPGAAALEEVRAKHGDVLEAIRKEKELSKATEDKLTAFFTAFTKTFA